MLNAINKSSDMTTGAGVPGFGNMENIGELYMNSFSSSDEKMSSFVRLKSK